MTSVALPGSVGGSPMTFTVNGKQYVALWVGRQPSVPAQLIMLRVDGAPTTP